MIRTEVGQELQGMTIAERIEFIELALGLIRRDLQSKDTAEFPPVDDVRARMTAAALLLRQDYENDLELTAFTALDGEEFLASG